MYNLSRNFSSIIKKNLISITPAAWSKMQTIGNKTKNNIFLFGASSGGCAGLNYEFKNTTKEYIDSITSGTKIPIKTMKNNEIVVHIDPLAEMYLIGTTIDYVSEDYSKGIYESKFIFIPDKDIAGGCGCGTSFYLKE